MMQPFSEGEEALWVSEIRHGARVTIDEEGCTAAAYTEIAVNGSAMPSEETVEFTVDRPFLFMITGEDGLPLFVGVVHQP